MIGHLNLNYLIVTALTVYVVCLSDEAWKKLSKTYHKLYTFIFEMSKKGNKYDKFVSRRLSFEAISQIKFYLT